jgi:hypothetical protein
MTEKKPQKSARTTAGLRDALFAELDSLRSGEGDPQRAQAVANIAKQIINVAKVEIDFHREVLRHAEAGHSLTLGAMQLGQSPVASAESAATEH